MATGGPFLELGRFLDDCEREEWEVTAVDVSECPRSERVLTADVDVAIRSRSSDDSGPGLALTSPRVGPDGTLRFAVQSAESLVPSEEYDVDVDPREGSVGPDGSVTVSFRATVGSNGREDGDSTGADGRGSGTRAGNRTDSGTSAVDRAGDLNEDRANDRTADGGPTAGGDRDLPPFKDPDYLRTIFESHDTFAEMAAAIEMDVTAETVRRYMIDYDIHQPNSYQTGTSTSDSDRADGVASGHDAGAESDEQPERSDDGRSERSLEGMSERSGDERLDRSDDEHSEWSDDEHDGGPETEWSDDEHDGGPETEWSDDERDGGRDGDGSPVETGDSMPGPQAPETASSAESGDDPEPVVLSDGIGLPDDVTVETLIDTVKRSNTLYEVTREMGIDRRDALDMLEELNLLDLVVGRLATEVERDLEREDIVERLRDASATG